MPDWKWSWLLDCWQMRQARRRPILPCMHCMRHVPILATGPASGNQWLQDIDLVGNLWDLSGNSVGGNLAQAYMPPETPKRLATSLGRKTLGRSGHLDKHCYVYQSRWGDRNPLAFASPPWMYRLWTKVDQFCFARESLDATLSHWELRLICVTGKIAIGMGFISDIMGINMIQP